MMNLQVATDVCRNNPFCNICQNGNKKQNENLGWRLEGGTSHLGDGEAQLGQLRLSHQRDVDAVGKHQVGVDDVLDDVVTKAAGKERRREGEINKLSANLRCHKGYSSISLASRHIP